MELVVRADGGPDIGYGHLIRSGALADEFSARGHSITYATTTPAAVRTVCHPSVRVVELPSRGKPGPFLSWIDAANPDGVFTDAYPVDVVYQRSIRERVPLSVLQDDARHTVCADLFFNGNLYAEDLDYEFEGHPPRTRLGPDYVLLRGEIRRFAARTPPWREVPERAIVTMGGSDVAGLTPTVVRAFDGFDLRVDAIVGPGCSRDLEQDVRDAAIDVSADVSVVRDPNDLADRMFEADLAVSTSGSTIYELLVLGTPIICCPVSGNQRCIASALRERDAASVVDGEVSRDAFATAIEEYLSDPAVRRQRRELGRGLVDGNGPDRVCSEILSLMTENQNS